jgi:adenylyltransferase/sulfurtransferase
VTDAPDLSRYHRQMLLPGFGEAGQRRLLDSTAVVLGCGALGTVVADALARAGVGHLRIVDRDFVELTNLQRQVLYEEADVREAIPKAEAARRRLHRVNSAIEITALVDDLNASSIERLAAGADVLVDGLDNFETRYLANDYAVKHGIPYVYGGAVGTAGLAFAVLPHTTDGCAPWESLPDGNRATPCLRCLFEEAPPPGESATCETAGVLGPLVGMIASFEAAEALKILTANFDRVCPTLLNLDLASNLALHLNVQRNLDDAGEGDGCPCCVQRDFAYLEGRSGSSATALCGRDAVQLRHHQDQEAPNLEELARRLRPHGRVVTNEFMLRAELTDNGQPFELTLFPDGRAIVKGTGEVSVARSLYAKYIGH